MMSKLSVEEYQKLIGERIKQYRVNAGVSQKDLEIESGVSVRSISRLEQGSSIHLFFISPFKRTCAFFFLTNTLLWLITIV